MRGVKRLSRKEARQLFNATARRILKVKDGQEYLVRYIEGEFRLDTADNVRVAMLIPMAR